MVAPGVREASCLRSGVRDAAFPALVQPPLSIAAKPLASTAQALVSLVPGLQARHLHALLIAANLFWYQAIRQCVGLLVVSMGAEFSYTTHQKGRLIAAPSVGNIITQMVGGMVEAQIGARATVGAAIAALAAGCTLLPLAASSSFSLAFLLLAAQGFFFGPMFPANSLVLSRWLNPSERGWAMAQGELAISLASMGVPLLIASIESGLGWRAGFYTTGFGCTAYLAIWLMLAANRPSECTYLSPEEAKVIREGQRGPDAYPVGESNDAEAPPASAGGKKPIDADTSSDSVIPAAVQAQVEEATAAARIVKDSPQPSATRILSHPAIVALYIVHMVYNLTTLSINSWMPTYYADVLGLSPDKAKLHLTLPHLAALVLKLCVSRIASALRASGFSMLSSRRLMCAIGFVATAVPLMALPLFEDVARHPPWQTTVLFCLALAGTGFHAEGFRANYLDVTDKHVGLISGMGNCLSSVAAMGAPLIVGALVQSHDGQWGPVWRAASGSCVVAAAIFGVFSSATPVEDQMGAGRQKAA
jgi:sugar phosphate permease